MPTETAEPLEATEQAIMGTSGDPEAQILQEPQAQEVKQEPKAFDPSTISPEVKAYYDKTYADYEKHKGMSQEYENLLRTKEFQEWYQGLKTPKQAQKFEISDEQFNSALADKNQFMALVSQLAERIAAEKLGPELQQTRTQLEVSQRSSELNETIKKHPDFMELDKRNLIEPYLRKYPGISFEDAYQLGRSHIIHEEIDRKARGIVDTKKSIGTERPSTGNGGRGSKIKVKDMEEAMEVAWEYKKSGKPEPEFEYTE